MSLGKIYHKVFSNESAAITYLNDPKNEVVDIKSITTIANGAVESTFYISNSKYQEYLDAAAHAAAMIEAEAYVKSHFKMYPTIGFNHDHVNGCLSIADSLTEVCLSHSEAIIRCGREKKYSAIEDCTLHIGGRLVFIPRGSSKLLISDLFIDMEDTTGIIKYFLGLKFWAKKSIGLPLLATDLEVLNAIRDGYVKNVDKKLVLEILGTPLTYGPVTRLNRLWFSCNFDYVPSVSIAGHVTDVFFSLEEAIKGCSDCCAISKVDPCNELLDFQLRHLMNVVDYNYYNLQSMLENIKSKIKTSKSQTIYLVHGKRSVLTNCDPFKSSVAWIDKEWYSTAKSCDRSYIDTMSCVYIEQLIRPINVFNPHPPGIICLEKWAASSAKILFKNKSCDLDRKVFVSEMTGVVHNIHPMILTEMEKLDIASVKDIFIKGTYDVENKSYVDESGILCRMSPTFLKELERLKVEKMDADNNIILLEKYAAAVPTMIQLMESIRDRLPIIPVEKLHRVPTTFRGYGSEPDAYHYVLALIHDVVDKWLTENKVRTPYNTGVRWWANGKIWGHHEPIGHGRTVREEDVNTAITFYKAVKHIIHDTPDGFLEQALDRHLVYGNQFLADPAATTIIDDLLVRHIELSPQRTRDRKVVLLKSKIYDLNSAISQAVHQKKYDVAHTNHMLLLEAQKEMDELQK